LAARLYTQTRGGAYSTPPLPRHPSRIYGARVPVKGVRKGMDQEKPREGKRREGKGKGEDTSFSHVKPCFLQLKCTWFGVSRILL